jgi:hypothetical protein
MAKPYIFIMTRYNPRTEDLIETIRAVLSKMINAIRKSLSATEHQKRFRKVLVIADDNSPAGLNLQPV